MKTCVILIKTRLFGGQPQNHYSMKTPYVTKPGLPISIWAEDDRPREKLLLHGKNSLSDTELLAILLGSGSRDESAVALSKRLLNSIDNDLHELARLQTADLKKFKGIGSVKAVTVVAAMELGRRRQLSAIHKKPQVKSSLDSYNLIAPLIMDLPHEEFWVLLLNRACRVVGRQLISRGGSGATVVDVKIVFQKAVETNATGMILCHNHPSGNCYPSAADHKITQKLKAGGKLLDIQILDHIIVADNNYYSFADEGRL